MLTCTCGNILVSNGYMWSCPLSGKTVTPMDKEGVHKGVIVIDKRVGVQKRPVA